jgi:hypothetical protein
LRAALEETVIRLEHRQEGDTAETIRRLKFLEGEISGALRYLEGDSSGLG